VADRGTLLQGALLIGAAGALVWALSERPVTHVHQPSGPGGGGATSIVGDAEALVPGEVERSPYVVPPTPSEELLVAFYGDRADAVRRELEERGVDLTTYSTPAPEEDVRAALPRWFTHKDVEFNEAVRSMQAWQTPLTGEWLAERYALTEPPAPNLLPAIDALAHVYNQDIEHAAQVYMTAVERAFQLELQRGNVQLSPFISQPHRTEGEAFLVTSRVGSGWTASLALVKDEHPEALAARGFVHDLIELRDANLRAAILGL